MIIANLCGIIPQNVWKPSETSYYKKRDFKTRYRLILRGIHFTRSVDGRGGVHFEEFQGWKAKTAGVNVKADLPELALSYIKNVERILGVSVSLISTGPERNDTITIEEPFVTE